METKKRLLRYLCLLSINLCLFSSVHSVPIETDNFDFYKDYLAKYYPKVFVMCRDYFIGMTANDFEKSLGSVVDLIAREPWFYFVNRPQGFKITFYWELIADQLSWINEFMRTAWCDPTTGLISMPTEDDDDDFLRAFLATGSLQQAKKNEYVDEHLIASGSPVIYDFYVLCFDYFIKLFNEALLVGDATEAARYLADLEYLMSKLHRSVYEAEYQEHIATAKELLELLKQKKVDNQDHVPTSGGSAQ